MKEGDRPAIHALSELPGQHGISWQPRPQGRWLGNLLANERAVCTYKEAISRSFVLSWKPYTSIICGRRKTIGSKLVVKVKYDEYERISMYVQGLDFLRHYNTNLKIPVRWKIVSQRGEVHR